jgi:hypothetical protein
MVKCIILGAVISGLNYSYHAIHCGSDTWLFENKLMPFCQTAVATYGIFQLPDKPYPPNPTRLKRLQTLAINDVRVLSKPPAPNADANQGAKTAPCP